MNIDKFKPAIVYTMYVASTPEKVWEALTSAAYSRKMAPPQRMLDALKEMGIGTP